MQRKSGQFQHTPQMPLAQESGVVKEKPPGKGIPGGGLNAAIGGHWRHMPVSVAAVVSSDEIAPAEPVIAPSVFIQDTNGASVT